MPVATLEFALRMISALLLGAAVGLERQWRQRLAGTCTNSLVAAGASAFVMAGSLVGNDPTGQSRMASYVVSGVGFLGAGVIFKDGSNVRGLNTAATIWCSAAIGVLAGLGSLRFASLLAIAVLLANMGVRPLAAKLHPVLPEPTPEETSYQLTLTCRAADEAHLRTLLLNTITQAVVVLHMIHSEDIEGSDRNRIRAEVTTMGRKNEIVEQIVTRLSFETGVAAVSWSIIPASME